MPFVIRSISCDSARVWTLDPMETLKRPRSAASRDAEPRSDPPSLPPSSRVRAAHLGHEL